MIYKLDEETKRSIEDLADLREHLSVIHASVQAGEDGQEEIQISISLLPSFCKAIASKITSLVSIVHRLNYPTRPCTRGATGKFLSTS